MAAVSGDVRRALELCRRASEVAELRQLSLHDEKEGKKATLPEGKVELKDVDKAIKEMFESPHMQVAFFLPWLVCLRCHEVED